MLTELQAIRLILDATTNDNLTAAIKALHDFADQKYLVNGFSADNINCYGQKLMNVEELRKTFPHPINEIA